MKANRVVEHFDHPAFLYESREDFLEYMVPYVSGAIEKAETVLVAAKGALLGPLRAEIGEHALVTLEDTEAWHPHPASRLRAFHEFLTDGISSGATHLRLAAEPVWPRGPAEYTYEWQRYESVLNAVLASFPASLVCLYDAAELNTSILEVAKHTHPKLYERGSGGASAAYEPPDAFLRRWNLELGRPPLTAERFDNLEDLPAARRLIQERATAAGVLPGCAADLSIAANEVLTNALLHGGGARALRVWTEDNRFICQIEDEGPGIGNALAGYQPPRSEGVGGRGLWVARQLVDLMQIDSGATGTIVRLHVGSA